MLFSAVLVAGIAAQVVSARAASQKDGAALFQTRCAACHGLVPARGKLGPPLRGVIGRRAASVAGYAYSDGLRHAGLVWEPRTLDSFLASPDRIAPGSKMPVSVSDPAARAALIAYLEAQGTGKPPAARR